MNLLTPTFWQAFRFWSKVDFSGECWNWKAYVMPEGYGQFGVRRKVFLAHRISHQLAKGTVPADMQVDHLCRNRRCVNPVHLEVVTCEENLRRALPFADNHAKGAVQRAKTHCPSGHEYSADNLRASSAKQGRRCKACHRQKEHDRYHSRKTASLG